MDTSKVEVATTSDESHHQRQPKIYRICVYCGSLNGRKEIYQEAAMDIGNLLTQRNIDLVYGGGSIGLMGVISCAVRSGEGHVIGVIPKPLVGKEITGDSTGDVRVVNGMHERKAEMSHLSDAFITLPGGFGMMEEFFEVITWAQLGIHKKPIGLLNVGGFYDPLLNFIDSAIVEGFISLEARNLVLSSPTAQGLILKLEEYEHNYDVGLLWPNMMADDCLPTQQHSTKNS